MNQSREHKSSLLFLLGEGKRKAFFGLVGKSRHGTGNQEKAVYLINQNAGTRLVVKRDERMELIMAVTKIRGLFGNCSFIWECSN